MAKLVDLPAALELGTREITIVNRWESGQLPKSRDEARAIVLALGLDEKDPDAKRLMRFAGYWSPEDEAVAERLEGIETGVHGLTQVAIQTRDMVQVMFEGGGHQTPVGGLAITASSAERLVFPGVVTMAVGYLLNRYSSNTETLLALIVLGVALVAGQGFLRIRRSRRARASASQPLTAQRAFLIGELFFLSLFVMLSAPLLQSAFTGMDAYGFFTLKAFAGKPLSLLLALGVNLILATIATAAYYGIWTWQHERSASGGAYGRALKVVIPSLLLVYVPGALMATPGGEIYLLVVLALMAFAFVLIIAMSDPQTRLREWEAKFLLATFVGAIFVLFIAAFTTMLLWFFFVDFTPPSGNHLWSWEIDWAALGYGPEEFEDRAKAGFIWAITTGIAYMIFVVGGYASVMIYRNQVTHNSDTRTPAPD
ncbi:MAG: hypothetical protein HY051_02205 [Candidatus Aenigmarchaeota archaeon]|nr:hypothetical protein [Candidatus Aenigmarchaeota archaeon]